jgi:hypothetical protein
MPALLKFVATLGLLPLFPHWRVQDEGTMVPTADCAK